MVHRMNEDGQIEWKWLEPGERILVHTDSYVYLFEMDKSGEAMKLVSDIASVHPAVSNFVRSSRNAQEVICNQDIDINDMKVYLRPDYGYAYLGAGHNKTLTYLRLYAKGPLVPWDACLSMDIGPALNHHLIRRIEPVAISQPASDAS